MLEANGGLDEDPFAAPAPADGGPILPPPTEMGADEGFLLHEWSRFDIGEGKDVDLPECPGALLKKQCIKYLGQPVGNKCFAKCVTKAGTNLSGSESSCISRCVDQYIEATGIINRALFSSQC